MKRKTTQRQLRQFCQLANYFNGYNEDIKDEFHYLGKLILKDLSYYLPYAKSQFKIWSNRGGIAVPGEIMYRAERCFIQLGGSYPMSQFMFRDETQPLGGTNMWMFYQNLVDNIARVGSDICDMLKLTPQIDCKCGYIGRSEFVWDKPLVSGKCFCPNCHLVFDMELEKA